MTMQPRYIANFDSAAAMLRSLSNALQGSDFPLLGTMPNAAGPAMRKLGAFVNMLPRGLRERIYALGGAGEAISGARVHKVDTDRLASWMTGLYPRRRYPAVMVGSSNGANTHLCALLGIPWLPQTSLVPVARSGVHPDEPYQDLEWGRDPARALLEANPDVQLHHMHDPNQDRLMVQRMTYFRIKRLKLPAAYRSFIEQTLEPGGVIFVVECALTWPTTHRGERDFFQFGALGGAEMEEYFQGGPRVEDYLRRYRSHRKRWEPPLPDARRPEAEWGFEPALREDIERFARHKGYKVRRIVFQLPEDMSPLVADFYESTLRERGITRRRLLIESFIVHEPYWALRTGSVPYWMLFNKKPSLAALNAYLDERPAFDDIYMMLFSHGVESVGIASIEEWRTVLARAARCGRFVGVDEKHYPLDFAIFTRYHEALLREVKARHPLASPLPLARLERFLAENEGRYRVQWLRERARSRSAVLKDRLRTPRAESVLDGSAFAGARA
jgi:hypothetical protein